LCRKTRTIHEITRTNTKYVDAIEEVTLKAQPKRGAQPKMVTPHLGEAELSPHIGRQSQTAKTFLEKQDFRTC